MLDNAVRTIEDYADIIDLPHQVSLTHPQMPMEKRAAQFSPFAALTGFNDAVEETARFTDGQIEIDEDRLDEIDWQMRLVESKMEDGERGAARITWFVKDDRKSGGSYKSVKGDIKKIDRIEKRLILTDGTIIPINDIISLTSI